MAVRSLREFQKELSEMLDAAYLDDDKAYLNIGIGAAAERVEVRTRLEVIKEIAGMAGIHRIERPHCFCGTALERTSMWKYCSNACKQKAHRIRHGQMKK